MTNKVKNWLMPRGVWLVCLSFMFNQAMAFEDPQPLMFAEEMLLGTSIRGDTEGIQLAIQRISNLSQSYPNHKRIPYLLGLAHWQLVYNASRSDPKAIAHANKAMDFLRQAIKDNPKNSDGYVAGIQCLFALMQRDPSRTEEATAEVRQFYSAAFAQNPQHPGLLSQVALSLFYGQAKKQEGIRKLAEAAQAYEKEAETASSHQRWWHATVLAWLGWNALDQQQPDVALSKKSFQRALELRPDFLWARGALSQSTERLMMCSSSETDSLNWRLIIEDAKSDGDKASGTDAKALHLAFDAKKAFWWFKVETHNAFNPAGFGINLAADTDNRQENGTRWWGGQSDFQFDYLITAWIAKDPAGQYTGTVGISSAEAAAKGQFTSLSKNNLAIHLSPDHKTVLLGVPHADLPFHGRVRILAAVGSNASWNDNLPNQGATAVHFAKP